MDMDRGQATALLARVDSGIVGHVQDLFRNVARSIRTHLVNRAGVDIPLRMAMVELGSLGAVLDRLQNQEGGVFARFTVVPANLSGLLVIQGPVLSRLVGLFLGEQPDSAQALYRWRPLTRLDLRIAHRLCGDILEGFADAAPSGVRTDTVLELVSANPRLPMPLERSTTVIEAALDFGPPEDPYGLVTMVLPAQIASYYWPKGAARSKGEGLVAGMDRVMDVPVTVVAELTRLRMSMGKIHSLRPGDLVELGVMRHAELKVGDRTVILAEAGEQDGYRSVRIQRVLASVHQHGS